MRRTILHSLTLIMLFQGVVYSIHLNCSLNDSCHCRNTVETARWQILCSLPEKVNLTVTLDHHYPYYATVHCDDLDTWPLENIEIFKIGGEKFAVKFDHCPLPEWPLSNMIEKVEDETMDVLEIRELTSTMSKLTRQNFLRLPRIYGLLLVASGVVEFSADALQDLADLQRIRFSQNEISFLPRGIFKGLTTLEELDLKDNKMRRVNSLLFEDLSRLKLLIISENYLESLEPGTFNDLVNLMYLDIEYNHLTTLPKGIFEPLEKLRELQISGNEFFSLPQRLFIGNSGLEAVFFSENRGNLSTLPDKIFGNLTSLTDVYVSGNNFTGLPEDIFIGSPRVEAVDLSRNKLSKVQEMTFNNLTSIYRIELSNNELNNLPDGLFEGLERLTSLNLDNNAITSISRNLLSKSINWITVTFDFNQISEIESRSFSNFTKLRDVSLRKNKLSNLPDNIFWGSFSLDRLDISENKLIDLPAKLFRDSSNLRELNLNANNLKNLPEDIFRGLGRLSHLMLQNNAFTRFPNKVLAQATSLRDLHFGFNRMTEINIDHLRCLIPLKFVGLSHNLITRIIPTTISKSELLRCTDIYNPVLENRFVPELTDLTLDHNNITTFLWNEMDNFENLVFLNLTDNRISSVELPGHGLINKPVTIDISRNELTKLAPIDKVPLNGQVRLSIKDNPIECGCDVYQLRKHIVDRSRFKFNQIYAITSQHFTCSQPVSVLERPMENLKFETFECKLHDSEKPRICFEECYCTWRPSDDSLVVNCANRDLTRAPYDFDGFEGIAIELNLAGNSITEMSFFDKHSWREYKFEKVRKIILSRNRIKNITFDVVPPNLRVLHLDNNNVTRFHVAVADTMRNTTSLQELWLHSNPWSCDGETREAFNILKEKLDRKIGHAFGKSCLDSRHNKNGEEKPTSYITYQMF